MTPFRCVATLNSRARFRCLLRVIAMGNAAVLLLALAPRAWGQPEEFQGVVAGPRWTVLHLQNARMRGISPLPASSKLKSLAELQFTGPYPAHPYYLGNYAADGKWGLVNGYIQRLDGNEAALQLFWGEDFELEGIIEQKEFGGFFLLLGWDQEHGYAISNITYKVSGSPWHVSELRGGKAVEGKSIEYDHLKWDGEQPFRLAVKDKRVTLKIGRFDFLDAPLENYKPGQVILGVYKTEYGCKPVRIKSLRVRSTTANVEKPEAE